MHIKDLKDQKGDRKLGRKTMPVFLGDRLCRIALVYLIPFWSFFPITFWKLITICSLFYCLLAVLIAVRVLVKRDQPEDAQTCRLWRFWHASLYTLPLLSNQLCEKEQTGGF